MGLLGMKKAMEKKIANNTYNKVPANIPKSILRKFNVEVEEFKHRKVWKISPKNNQQNTLIIFLHGGAYYANITQLHWQLVEELIFSSTATFIVPDYPLAPESTCIDTYQFLDTIYTKLIPDNPSTKIVFMGDSSGGGLALGYAQKIRNENVRQPDQIILFSPWLDATLANPRIQEFEKLDKILSLTGLKNAGKKYAGDMDVEDFRVSPIKGEFTKLGKISIFIGTNEIFIADARKLKQILEEQKIDFNYFEYPNMFHDWVVVTHLKETKQVIRWITSHILPF